MQPPHRALPWPTIDPDELSQASVDLRSLATLIGSETGGWLLDTVDWTGRSAVAHQTAHEWIRTRIRPTLEAVSEAERAIHLLEQVVRSARDEILRLAEAVHAAQALAGALEVAAARAAEAVPDAPVIDPASGAETLRLRQAAVVARARAEDAHREADAVLRRAVSSATETVDDVERHDRLVADHLDSLITTPLRIGSKGPVQSLPVGLGSDRSWIDQRMAGTTAAIRRHVDALSGAVADLAAVPWAERSWWESMALLHLTEQLELHDGFLSTERQILDWDPAGDGRVVEVFGDLGTARHIAVVVPGIMNTIANFDDQLAGDASALWHEAAARDEHTAVIAWLGYDTPELLNAVSKGRAVEYEPQLRAFVDSLPDEAHVTVVAHSYGSVLTGEAASRGLAADDVVFVGSPGTRLDHAAEADLEHGAQVFAGVSDSDYVGRSGYGSIICPEKVLGIGWLTSLPWVASPATGPLSWVTDSCNTDGDGDVKRLSHGINPAHDDFGAIEISTDGIDGHSSYFEPDSSSLEAIADIVTGSHPGQR